MAEELLTEEDFERDVKNNRIPSLREVLELCKDKIHVNIELKNGTDK